MKQSFIRRAAPCYLSSYSPHILFMQLKTFNYTNYITCALGKRKAYRSLTQKHLIKPLMSCLLLERTKAYLPLTQQH